jgi:hypothetical protein
LSYLLGYSFMPRLRDLADQQLYKLDRKASFGKLDTLFRGTADTELIAEQWDQLVRVTASLKNRTAPANVIIQRLANDPDLMIRDTLYDAGFEPNPDTGPMWISPDIWVPASGILLRRLHLSQFAGKRLGLGGKVLDERWGNAAQQTVHLAQCFQPCQMIEQRIQMLQGGLFRRFLDFLKGGVPLDNFRSL